MGRSRQAGAGETRAEKGAGSAAAFARHASNPRGAERVSAEARAGLGLAAALALLEQVGITPDALRPATIDESVSKGEVPRHIVRRLARAKCEAALKLIRTEKDYAKAFVLAADTVVAVGRRVLGNSIGIAPAKRQIDALLQESLVPALTQPTFYAVGGGWRCFAKAHMAAVGAPVPVVHGYSLSTSQARGFAKQIARMSPAKLAGMPGVPSRRVRTLPAAALLLDRVLKRLAPDRVVFSALGLREGWLYAQLAPAERYLDPLVEGAQLVGLQSARVPGFAAALVSWTESLFLGEMPGDTRLRVAVCALSDIAWRDHADLRAEESYRRLLQFPFIGIDHAERVFVAASVHARYAGRPDAPWLAPAINLLSAAARRRAMILGRAILLAYRLTGGMPAVLASSRLHIEADRLCLEVSPAARGPDSEAVRERLSLLAQAMDARGFDITELAE